MPQSRTGEVAERVDFARARCCAPLDETALRETVRALVAEGVESVAVCLLFSFLHPEHEARVRDIVAEEMPGCGVSLSSDILPQIREYYRLSTTVINAYLQPILARYIASLDRAPDRRRHRRRGRNTSCSRTAACRPSRRAARKAVTTVLSGPAGGVTAGAHACRTTGLAEHHHLRHGRHVLRRGADQGRRASIASRGKIEGRDIAVPMMDINTVSAGGGTIARVDRFGALEVGPDSAGAVPGPACYGRGGSKPTITDCNLVLGLLSPDNFLGGRMRLDAASAPRAIETHIAKPLA